MYRASCHQQTQTYNSFAITATQPSPSQHPSTEDLSTATYITDYGLSTHSAYTGSCTYFMLAEIIICGVSQAGKAQLNSSNLTKVTQLYLDIRNNSHSNNLSNRLRYWLSMDQISLINVDQYS